MRRPLFVLALLFSLLVTPGSADAYPVIPPTMASIVASADAGDVGDVGDEFSVVDDDSAAPAEAALIPNPTQAEAMDAIETLSNPEDVSAPAIAAALLTLVVFSLRKTGLLAQLPKKALPWVAVILGMAYDITTGLAAGVPVAAALTQGLLLGASAVGLWELVGKNLVPTKKENSDP